MISFTFQKMKITFKCNFRIFHFNKSFLYKQLSLNEFKLKNIGGESTERMKYLIDFH